MSAESIYTVRVLRVVRQYGTIRVRARDELEACKRGEAGATGDLNVTWEPPTTQIAHGPYAIKAIVEKDKQ